MPNKRPTKHTSKALVARVRPNNIPMDSADTRIQRGNAQYRSSLSRIPLVLAPNFLMRQIRSRDPFPPRFNVDLRYASSIILTTAGVVIGNDFLGTEYVFRLNSLFDPDLTSTGHQPFGYDQLTTMYGSYCVTGCMVDITLTEPSSNDIIFCMTAQTGQDTTPLTNAKISTAIERQNVLTQTIQTTGRNVVKIRQFFPIHQLVGLPHSFMLYNPNYQALVSADPASQCYLRMAVGNLTASSADNLKAVVLLTFKAFMFNRITPGAS